LSYVNQRTASLKECWHPVSSYANLAISEFPSIKCFGNESSAFRISESIRLSLGLCASPIRDPYDENYFVIQATHPKICKGQALKDLSTLLGGLGKLIAAGDDLNDISMLASADIKIVMATAPSEMLKMADIVAPPASEEGIISGLKQALENV
jgi:hydroxymethylpyrimidine pyrophosphatase-like HAD family hydrolase